MSETALADLDGSLAAIRQDHPVIGPPDFPMECCQAVPQSVSREQARTFRNVTIKERADASPIWFDQGCPGVVQQSRQPITRAFRISHKGLEPRERGGIGPGVDAAPDFACHLRGIGRPDLIELPGYRRHAADWRRRQEVRHVAEARENGQQRRPVNPGRIGADPLQPPAMIGPTALVRHGLHGCLRLPQGRDGEPDREHTVAIAHGKQRHRRSTYAQERINCLIPARGDCLLSCQEQASRHDQ